MWMLWVFLLFWACLKHVGAVENQNVDEQEQQKLTQMVEDQIQNYLSEVKRTLGLVTEQNKKKRSADFTVGRMYGTEVLSGFQELFIIPSKFPNDILLFTKPKPEGKYAVSLESDAENPQTSFANKLVLYFFDGEAWIELDSQSVNGGISLASLNIQGNTYIVVAEHYAGISDQLIEGSSVYVFNETDSSLQYVQLLNTKYAYNVIMWERSDMNEAFVAVATYQNSDSGETRYSTQSIVYRWLGSHFDIVDYLPTNNPRSIVQFNIGSFMFLAVANYQDNYGNTNIDSEIFRYDLNSGKFTAYQKLRTSAALDIKYFCFESPETTESFLVVANHFEKDDDGNINYEANSIIYKLSDEQYFIPFQSIKLFGVKEWVPYVRNVGETGAFLLLAICEQGVVAFQYDGWRFVKSAVQYSRSWFGQGISSIRTFELVNQTVFTVANKNNPGTGANVFLATFYYDSRMDVFYQDVENWCENTLAEVATSGFDEMVNLAEHAPKKDSEEIVLYSNLELSDAVLNSVKTETWLTEDSNIVDYMTTSLNRLSLEVIKPQQDLEMLEETIEAIFVPTRNIYDNIDIDEATINCTKACNFRELNLGTLNGEDIKKFLQSVVIDDEGMIIKFDEEVEFENLAVLNPIDTNMVNGHPVDTLIDWSQENVLSHGMVVNGSVTLKSGLDVDGALDGVVVDEKSVWVIGSNQSLLGSVKLHSVEVGSLTLLGSLNGFNVGPNSAVQSRTQYLKEVNATELVLSDRVLNGEDLENINLVALKKKAEQQLVTGKHFYYRMDADHVIVSGMVYQIVPNEYPENQVNYTNNNAIPSEEDSNTMYTFGKSANETVDAYRKPKYLVPYTMKNSSEGFIFDSNERESITDSMRSAAAAAGIDLISRNSVESVEIIEEDFTFSGNLKINGTAIIVNGSLLTEDLISVKHNLSAKTILDKGLRLNETNIPVRMIFNTPFSANKISVEKINNIKMENLVPTNSSKTVTITGHKTFADGLRLEGHYKVTGLVNGVNISQLVSDTLQSSGDQNITGSWLIGNIVTDKITSGMVYLNNTKWENSTLIEDGLLRLDSVSIEGDVNVDHLTVQGKVSDKDIEDMLQDSLFVNDESAIVTGFKNFTNRLSINKLKTPSISGLNMDVLTRAAAKNNIWNSSELVLDYPIRVEHLMYTDHLDGIHANDFGKWLLSEGDQEVIGQQTVRSIQALGGLVAKTINNVDIDRLLTETRRIDANETLDHVVFNKKVISVGGVYVDGNVQGLDLSEESVVRESPQQQLITGRKTFLFPLTINGSLQLKGKVNGFDLTEFCVRVMDNSTKFIIKNGTAMFEMEPFVKESVNGYVLNELLENIWFIHENTTVQHHLEFADARFLNTTLQGEINGISLKELSTNYLSKTMNQTWTGDIHFSGGITVRGSLAAPSATVGNLVSGINIEQFKDRVLLDGEDQIIDGVLDFGDIEIEDPFTTTGLINDLDLLQDVMRSDILVNFVKGHKVITKVDVLNLSMPPRNKIQNVDIVDWEKSAVKTSGNFVIEGEKTFNGPFHAESNIRVDGLVNGVPFDATNIMHSTSQQTVTGRKVFDENSSLYIRDLELSGLLNGINMTDFFSKQILVEGNVTITGSKQFSKALEAHRIYLNNNRNLTEMELRLKTPLPCSQFDHQINVMNSKANEMRESLQENRLYLKNYTRHADLEGIVLDAVPVKNSVRETLIAVTRLRNVSKATLVFMKWSPTDNTFNEAENTMFFTLTKQPTGLQSITMQDGQRGLVVKSEVDPTKGDNDLVETFLFLSNYSIRRLHRFTVPKRSVILHFEDKEIKCYIIANSIQNQCLVYCYTARKRLHKRPAFDCYNMTQSFVLSVTSGVYVVTTRINKTLSLHKWNSTSKQFNPLRSQILLNPISVASVSYDGYHFIAVANQHLVGNTTAESVDIYRLLGKSKELVLFQQLFVVAPAKVEFAILPSSELVLYMLSENKATPFLVFVYRGIAGFKHFYTESTLPLISHMSSVTDEEKRHFVILTNKIKAMILQANFT